jgi:hypothetical protein
MRTTGVPRYHLNSLFYLNTNENNALEFAITGNPVLFYLPVITSFLQHYTRRLQRCFPVETSTSHLLLYQTINRLLLLNRRDYKCRGEESQENKNAILASLLNPNKGTP